MKTISTLRLGIALALAAPVLNVGAPSSASAQGIAELPIFDAHVHYSQAAWGEHPVEAVQRRLRSAGVLRALVSSSPDDGTLTLHRADPQRFVPVLRPYRGGVTSGTWTRDPDTPAYMRQRLERGGYVGLGEFHLLDAESARADVVRAVAKLAVERGLLLHIHSDAAPVQAIFDYEPQARILWAHAGMVSPPEEVRAMVERHRRLWVELSFREHEILGGGSLHPLWRALLTDHSDRFLVGSDTYTSGRWESYEAIISNHRRYLALLPPDVARSIAYGNAVRLFGDGGAGFPKD